MHPLIVMDLLRRAQRVITIAIEGNFPRSPRERGSSLALYQSGGVQDRHDWSGNRRLSNKLKEINIIVFPHPRSKTNIRQSVKWEEKKKEMNSRYTKNSRQRPPAAIAPNFKKKFVDRSDASMPVSPPVEHTYLYMHSRLHACRLDSNIFVRRTSIPRASGVSYHRLTHKRERISETISMRISYRDRVLPPITYVRSFGCWRWRKKKVGTRTRKRPVSVAALLMVSLRISQAARSMLVIVTLQLQNTVNGYIRRSTRSGKCVAYLLWHNLGYVPGVFVHSRVCSLRDILRRYRYAV